MLTSHHTQGIIYMLKIKATESVTKNIVSNGSSIAPISMYKYLIFYALIKDYCIISTTRLKRGDPLQVFLNHFKIT